MQGAKIEAAKSAASAFVQSLGPKDQVALLLFGDRIVGRIEPRFERRAGELAVLGIWFEPDFGPMEEPSFIPALATALGAYSTFVGANTVSWPRTRLGRDLAGALRRHEAAA